ncbi:hypothetical protein BT63DRAFT_449605 [Microthyrium microscopicum]|uniref:Uncharacterized protein n=1 Tax=Microthyrium microscopicum TaxID=703497 RepID=A0A6A6US82_9PEZI|nr:hypothetical protein BT63DRAFT_449605 [Microthyrium microscopicum]
MWTTTQVLIASITFIGLSEQQGLRPPWAQSQKPPAWAQSNAPPAWAQSQANQPPSWVSTQRPPTWTQTQAPAAWPTTTPLAATWQPRTTPGFVSSSSAWPPRYQSTQSVLPPRSSALPPPRPLVPSAPRPASTYSPRPAAPAATAAPRPAGETPGWGTNLQNGLGNLLGAQRPLSIRMCPKEVRCTGLSTTCVPHPYRTDRFMCVKVDDECGTIMNPKCPSGQTCLADPRDTDSCKNGWCTSSAATGGGICVTPPKD